MNNVDNIQSVSEAKRNKLCHNVKPETNPAIGKLINKIERAGGKVYVTTDWHLFTRLEKGKKKCKPRDNFNEIINNYRNTVTDKDCCIFLGDLCDGEFGASDELANVISTLPGTKILCLGNNDLFDYEVYRNMGFAQVVYTFIWRDILFSHYPLVNTNKINIHGHLHGCRKYWIPYTNQIDVFAEDRKPQTVISIINKQPEYAKHVVVKENMFGQESVNVFSDEYQSWYDEWYRYHELCEDPTD